MATLNPPFLKRMMGVISYKGKEGQLTWLLHRLSGLGVMLFLLLHIFDIWLMGMGKEVFSKFLFFYHAPPFKVLVVFLLFGVLFHAVNGARIILIDFVPGLTRHQRKLVWIETVILLAVLLPAIWVTLEGLFKPHA